MGSEQWMIRINALKGNLALLILQHVRKPAFLGQLDLGQADLDGRLLELMCSWVSLGLGYLRGRWWERRAGKRRASSAGMSGGLGRRGRRRRGIELELRLRL